MPRCPKTSCATSKGAEVRLLFDTHVWLWFVHGDKQLPAAFLQAIKDPANSVVLSVVSAWEVAIKSALGKLRLRASTEAFLDDATLQFDILDVSIRHVRTLQLLPSHHRDPFDRMLIAQAHCDNLTLLTVDPVVRSYAINCLSL
jgi:PIN domain nuclease of toxin-antitoxin system